MSVASCYWALLSLEKFEFIYLPSLVTDTQMDYGVKAGDILKSKSLLDFIHPDELSLATTDLLNFVQIKTLAGAVTRCRLRNIQSLIHQEHHRDNVKVDNLQNWIITDVVMYTATNNAILTFFHSLQLEIDNTAANHNNMSRHTNLLDTPIPANPTATTFTPIITTNDSNTTCCGTGQLSPDESNKILSILQEHSLMMDEPLRLFQIYDTQCQQLLISWPNTAVTESVMDLTSSITLKEMDRRLEHPQLKSDAAACTHHSHSRSNMLLESNKMCQIERIIITYGNLTFTCFQIIALKAGDRLYYTRDHSSSSSCTSNNNNSNGNNMPNQSVRKSNLSKILNSTTTNTTATPPGKVSSPNQQIHHYSHDIQTNKKSKNGNGIDQSSLVSAAPPFIDAVVTSKSSENTRAPLPRAWRGRFGVFEKKCENCQTNTSPEWRKGPGGHKTLCNACGLRYARLVAKHEKRQYLQQPKDEEQATLLLGVGSSTTKFKNYKSKK
ncbi:hypothetical protein MAM1_0040d02857 [Mucor ambiguus]|uniref:GATA-type domain-containing protein n=1 Tax=Mucor ambiguus TaxID=91626 RepID=A0A0C9M8F5_9FUNG|nr:hypothetical protein MAM1_0040d02857 [Mucor ambiguus]